MCSPSILFPGNTFRRACPGSHRWWQWRDQCASSCRIPSLPNNPLRFLHRCALQVGVQEPSCRSSDAVEATELTVRFMICSSPSCTRPSGWSQSADRGSPFECAVASSSVVELEPGRKGAGPLGVGAEDLVVGPLGLQGAVEPFHLAVLPWAVWLDEVVCSSQLGDSSGHLGRSAVAEVVVGEHSLDTRNTLCSKVVGSSGEKARAGGPLLVGQDL